MEYSTERRDEPKRWLPVAVQTLKGAEELPPFFMSVASPSNHWMFLSSLGPLTTGRRSKGGALFPYKTVDQIHDSVGRVGGRTLVRRRSDGAVWEPFTERSAGLKGVTRTVSRSAFSTWVTLAESHAEFGLEVRQTWTTSPFRGVLRFVEFEAAAGASVDVDVLDGVIDVLPASVEPAMQAGLSSLMTAYRMAERIGPLAVYRLGSIPVDRAEPNEALLGSTVWSTAEGAVLLSENQIEAFRAGAEMQPEGRSRGVRGAFLVASRLQLAGGTSSSSALAMEIEQAADKVEGTIDWIASQADPYQTLRREADQTELDLAALLASADALQRTASFAEDARHYANTLYNAMRGGLPIGPYAPPSVEEAGSADEFRHAVESLPLGLSRRHGDPSRPWNRFFIDIETPDGSLKAAYEGNWRDIFQNWEALGVSYPKMLFGFVSRFLNATTADGYNPYRVDSERGIDWEVEDPHDPWSYIGYWGDHQIVYLTKLLERLDERFPGALKGWLGSELFVFADVPYRIAGFDDLARDPSNSVRYDKDAAARTKAREDAGGGKDARLLHASDGKLVRATLEEKLLVPTLAKLASFVPGAGVWMNTQRPEWNDANNALAGFGSSIVTTAALYGHIGLFQTLLSGVSPRLSERTRDLLVEITEALDLAVGGTDDPSKRWAYLERAGRAGEAHREAVYAGTGIGAVDVDSSVMDAFLARAHAALGATLAANERKDGLFHAYRLLSIEGSQVEAGELPLMLEGQAAVLASGFLAGKAAVQLLSSLRSSPLYRDDLGTYLLYPDRELPSILDLGRIPTDVAASQPLIQALLERGNKDIVRRSESAGGSVRFAPGMRTAVYLRAALAALPDDLQPMVEAHGTSLEEAYETSFQHASFLGRSGSFFGYEGLGCTYWHMVSKLSLSVQESALRASDAGDTEAAAELFTRYREVRDGIGAGKTPKEYGAFPSEPYSHSPADGRVRQPGMTGQVKEDLLARLAEAGIRVRGGRITFDPSCVVSTEFLNEPAILPRPAASGPEVMIPAGAFAISHCGVPVVLHRGAIAGAEDGTADGTKGLVHLSSGATVPFEPREGLDLSLSRAVFDRSGEVVRIDVSLG